MTYSEQILEELIAIARRDRSNLFEAAADYCDEHDLDQAEFIKSLDDVVVQRIKMSAMDERKVRRCVQEPRVGLL